MKIKNLISMLFLITNGIAFSQSVSTNTKIQNSVLMLKTTKAFQIKSENKIVEFYDILNVVGSPSLKLEVRVNAIFEILKFFKDKNIKIPNFIENENKEIMLQEFLTKMAKSKQKIYFETQNMVFSSLQEIDGTKFWTVSYGLNINIGNEKSSKNINHNISLLQEEKYFGGIKKTVQNCNFTAIKLK
jgi:hypothetical protein